MSTKIAFFDIDGTLTSEVDGSLPRQCDSCDKAGEGEWQSYVYQYRKMLPERGTAFYGNRI